VWVWCAGGLGARPKNDRNPLLTPALRASAYDKTGVTGRETIKNLSVENHRYLERHRNEIQ